MQNRNNQTPSGESEIAFVKCFRKKVLTGDRPVTTKYPRLSKWLAAAVLGGFSLSTAWAQKAQFPGVTDTEIRIGNTAPYSGPGSAYSTIAKVEAAYFKMINDSGGVNGRKINFISYDDSLSPPKTVEQTRKLVESDEVLAMFNTIGTAANLAAQKYLNAKQVPQLLVGGGATNLVDHKKYPWTLGWQPTYYSEGVIYGKHILANFPNAKIAVLSQNDDFGKDYLSGLKQGLGEKGQSMIVSESTYEPSDPTIDSQVLKLKASGADVLMNITTPKFASQVIKKIAEIGWKPTHYLINISVSVGAVMKPAGIENSQGILSTAYLMESTDARWKDHPDMKAWVAFMDKYLPGANKADSMNVYGYVTAQALVQILSQSGGDLSRANVMKQAASLNKVPFKLMLPGIVANTTPANLYPIQQLQMMRLKGEQWELFGPVISSGAGQ
ncbi:ABC transporter substrate-binding protein [Acidovorax delafieldii]|uniref:ABC transporter substrate-binding protein n=1 Tax=Acidovorax delafieldii TaxID=47920 RepID=UPI003ECDC336